MDRRIVMTASSGALGLLALLVPIGCGGSHGYCPPTGTAAAVVAPRFAGVRSVATAGGPLFRIDWLPSEDDKTPQAETVYQVFLSLTSGGQDFSSPVQTTGPGVLTAFVSSADSSLVAIGSEVFIVVRAMDTDGAVDDNTAELSVLLVEEADVRYVAPGGSGTGGIGSPSSSLQSAVASVEAGGDAGVVIFGTGSVSTSQPIAIGAGTSTVPLAFYGAFDLSGIGTSATPRDVLEARDPSIGAAQSRVVANGALGSLLSVAGGKRTAIDGLTFAGASANTTYIVGDSADLRISGARFEGDSAEAQIPTISGIGLSHTSSTAPGTVLRLTGSDLAGNLKVGVRVEGLAQTVLIQGCRFDSLNRALVTETAAGVDSTLIVPTAATPATGAATLSVVITDNLLRPLFAGGMSFKFEAQDAAKRGDLSILVARNIFHQIGGSAIQLDDVGLFGDGGSANLGTATVVFEDNDVQVIEGDALRLDLLTGSAVTAGATNIHGNAAVTARRNRYAAVDREALDFGFSVRASSTVSAAISDEIATAIGKDYFLLTGADSRVSGSDGGSLAISVDRVALTGCDEGLVNLSGRLLPRNGTFECAVRSSTARVQTEARVYGLSLNEKDTPPGTLSTLSTPNLTSKLEISHCEVISGDSAAMNVSFSPPDGKTELRVTDNVLRPNTNRNALSVTCLPREGTVDASIARNDAAGGSKYAMDLLFFPTETGSGVVEVVDNLAGTQDNGGIWLDLDNQASSDGELTVLVANNTVDGADTESIRFRDRTPATARVFALFAQNTLTSGGDDAIQMEANPGGRYQIANNAVSFLRNDGNGITFHSFDGGPGAALIRNNLVAATGDDGIDISSADYPVQIENNTLFENGDGSRGDGGVDSDTSDGFSQVSVLNTIVSRPSHFSIGGFTLNNGSFVNARASYTLADEGLPVPGFGNLEGAPGYAFGGTQRDFDAFYALGPDSIARDKGNPAARFNDRDGTRNDLGAFGGPGGYGVGRRTDMPSVPFVLIGTDPLLGLETGAALLSTTTTEIRLVFSRDVDPLTVTDASVRLNTASGTVAATLATSGHVVTLTPTTALPAGTVVTLEALAEGIQTTTGETLTVPGYFDFGTVPTVAVAESEPNDTTASSTDLGAVKVVEVGTATLSSLGDEDHYRIVGVAAGERLQVSVFHERDGGNDDVALQLLDASGTVLYASEDRFGDAVPATTSTDPFIDFLFDAAEVTGSGGVFFVRVYAQSFTSGNDSYRLQLVRR